MRKPGVDGVLVTGADDVLGGGDHDTPDDSRPLTPEQRLWFAVILNAIRDAFERGDASLEHSDTEPDGEGRTTAEVIRGDARRWLCSDIEPWRSDRIEVCSMAGIDADVLQRAAKAKLATMRAADEKRSRRERERTVRMLDERLQRLVVNPKGHSEKMMDLLMDKLVAMEDARI